MASATASDAGKHRQQEDVAKSEFVTIVAHQLRTPLSAVKWVMKMLLDGDVGELTPEQKSLLLKGYASNERMINFVNDMLNVALIETSRLRYRFASRSVEEVLHQVLLDFVAPLQRKKIRLSLDAPGELPNARVDTERIATVLHNLIDNAVQYTPPGGHVSIALKNLGDFIEITVQDTGIGIPRSQQGNIFTRFYRGENAMKFATDGSGLGLFVVKSIVEQHRGKVWFTSRENGGTTFHVTIPTANH